MEKWKRLDSRIIHRDQWISLRADKCELPNARTIEPSYVVEQKDSVHVVAVDAPRPGAHHPPISPRADCICAEIPCGVVERGEPPLAAARRELKEETGYVAREWVAIISPFANPARLSNRIHCFLARDLTDTGLRNLDDTEEIEFAWLPETDVKKKIFDGEF